MATKVLKNIGNVVIEGKSTLGCKFIVKNGTEFIIDKRMGYSKTRGMLVSIKSVQTGVKTIVDVSGKCKDFTIKFR
jgi:hypothetical protein